MSDKPKIYAHCKAGCLWETVHRSELDEVKKAAENGGAGVAEHLADKENPHGVTAEQTGAEKAGAVATHNTANNSHNDIRLLIEALTTRLNTLADSDDTTLDQLSELVEYIKDNRELIEQVTTAKVSVVDIIDNLVTNVSNKPLSAAQGVVLKGLIDTLQTAVNGKAASGHGHENATTSNAGFMSAQDKINLDNLVASAVSVLSGSATPTAEQGEDGDIYLVTE